METILTPAPHQCPRKQGAEEGFQAQMGTAFWVSENDKLLHGISYSFILCYLKAKWFVKSLTCNSNYTGPSR